jgi:hypothetical protein
MHTDSNLFLFFDKEIAAALTRANDIIGSTVLIES